MESKLKVFITGASSGIGSALAEEYAKQGAIIGLAARRQEKLEQIKSNCESLGAEEVVTYNLDVTNEEESMSVANDFINLKREGIDVVIANAGVAFSDSLSSGNPKQINQTLAINILGVTNTIVPFIPNMKNHKSGSLVIISSIASFTAPPYLVVTQHQKLLSEDWLIPSEDLWKNIKLMSRPFVRVISRVK